jgi:D-inositol-3-phosphate glycosyltransferase
MKIGVLSFHSSPFSVLGGESVGGMNVYLKELNSALTKNYPCCIDVFTRCQDPKYQGITQVDDAARIIHLKAGPERQMRRESLFKTITEFTYELQKFMHNGNYDLIYSHYWLSGLIGEEVKKSIPIPHVFNYHTLEFLKKRVLQNQQSFCRITAEKSLAEDTDAIISSSQEEKTHLIEEYGLPSSKIKVIYPGVNDKIFFPDRSMRIDQEIKRRESDFIFLYTGRVEPVKGLDNLIEAWHLLKKHHPEMYERARLVIIGGGRRNHDFEKNPEIRKLQSIICRKSLQERIIFLGSRPQRKLRCYFSAADAVIMPSLYESFGLVAVEALACGTPVIVSRIGKIKSIVTNGENGFSCSPDNPEALADSLASFPKKRKHLHSSRRIRTDIIRKFSWENTAAETYALFSRLTGEHEPITTRSLPGESLQPA